MKIGPILDVRETDDRREKFKNNVASGKWFACVASADLGYFIPITKQRDGYWHSLPNEFRRLGIRRAHKRSFFDARREAEHRIVEAASVCGDSVPMLVFFDPKEKKRVARRGNRLARSPITQQRETAQINLSFFAETGNGYSRQRFIGSGKSLRSRLRKYFYTGSWHFGPTRTAFFEIR